MAVEYFTLHLPVEKAPDLPGLKPHDPKRGVRVVKDALPVGRWKSPRATEPWDVTPQTLATIARDFDAMKSNGRASKLYWGNFRDGAKDQHDVTPRDEIGEVDQVIVHGNTLWVACYCTDEAEAAKLKKQQVSVAVKPNFKDSTATYELALLHVAVVDQPVVTGQGPFFTMSNESPETGDESMLLANLKTQFGLGDDVTADNISDAIKAKLAAPKPDDKTIDVSDDGKNLAAVVKQQAARIAKQDEQLKTLAESVTKLVAREELSAKDAYNAKVEKLFKGGQINAAKKTELAKLGPINQYNLSLLSLFDDIQTLANGQSVTKTLANGDEPDLGGGETDAQRDARLKAGGYEPLRVM